MGSLLDTQSESPLEQQSRAKSAPLDTRSPQKPLTMENSKRTPSRSQATDHVFRKPSSAPWIVLSWLTIHSREPNLHMPELKVRSYCDFDDPNEVIARGSQRTVDAFRPAIAPKHVRASYSEFAKLCRLQLENHLDRRQQRKPRLRRDQRHTAAERCRYNDHRHDRGSRH